MKRRSGMKVLLILLVSVMLSAAIVPFPVRAANPKKIRSISVKIGTKNVAKRTCILRKGSSAKLIVTVKPKSAKKSVTFRSGNKKIVTVNKKGRLAAKKTGTVKISITVKARKGKKKTTWVKVKVTGAAVKQGKADSGRSNAASASGKSATCSHSWTYVRGENIEQPPVYIREAKAYNVCRHCGYIGSFEEVARHCSIFGGSQESMKLGPEFYRQDWIRIDHYKCSKCGKEKTEKHTETGEEQVRFYENPYLDWDIIDGLGMIRCPVCNQTSKMEWLERDSGYCICGAYIDYTEEDIIYPWNVSKAFPNYADEHYRSIDEQGNLTVLK